MVLFNYSTKEITAKIVYYGPGLCGKTTNLQFVYEALPSNHKSKMLSLATKADRTLFFDFLPLDLGKIRGMRTRVQLYTVPGQVYYNSTRQLVLKGADGVVFVADSQENLVDANIESWNNLKDNLRKQGVDYRKLPIVMQYNKRDLPEALEIEQLEESVNELGCPWFETVATTGVGVEKTLRGITRLVLKDLMQRYGLSSDVTEEEIHLGGADRKKTEDEVWADDDKKAGASDAEELEEVSILSSAPSPAAQVHQLLEVTELHTEENAGFALGSAEVVSDSQTEVAARPLSVDNLVGALKPAAQEVEVTALQFDPAPAPPAPVVAPPTKPAAPPKPAPVADLDPIAALAELARSRPELTQSESSGSFADAMTASPSSKPISDPPRLKPASKPTAPLEVEEAAFDAPDKKISTGPIAAPTFGSSPAIPVPAPTPSPRPPVVKPSPAATRPSAPFEAPPPAAPLEKPRPSAEVLAPSPAAPPKRRSTQDAIQTPTVLIKKVVAPLELTASELAGRTRIKIEVELDIKIVD